MSSPVHPHAEVTSTEGKESLPSITSNKRRRRRRGDKRTNPTHSLEDDEEEESKEASPRPPLPAKKKKETKYNDYRQYLVPLLSLIRFPLMKSEYFTEKVLPLDILQASQSSALLQLYAHPFIPPKTVLDNTGLAQLRCARDIQTEIQNTDLPFPILPPTLINKEHSTCVQTTLQAMEGFSVIGKKQPFPMGSTTGFQVRFVKPLTFRPGGGLYLSLDESCGHRILLQCVIGENWLAMCHRGIESHESGERADFGDDHLWKEEFLRLKEVILVLRKFEHATDDDKITFEGNVVVNNKLLERVFFDVSKNSQIAKCSERVLADIIFDNEVDANASPVEYCLEISDIPRDF